MKHFIVSFLFVYTKCVAFLLTQETFKLHFFVSLFKLHFFCFFCRDLCSHEKWKYLFTEQQATCLQRGATVTHLRRDQPTVTLNLSLLLSNRRARHIRPRVNYPSRNLLSLKKFPKLQSEKFQSFFAAN